MNEEDYAMAAVSVLHLLVIQLLLLNLLSCPHSLCLLLHLGHQY